MREASIAILICALCSTTLLLPAAAAAEPTFMPAERPDNWTCDASGQLVCAGANAGADVDCTIDREHVVACSYTYGQLMGGASPLGLPGEASFSWSVDVEICHKDSSTGITSCSVSSAGGDDTCTWPAAFECVLSLGPNDTTLDPIQLDTGDCYEVTVTPSATATAWTLQQDGSIAEAEHSATGSNADVECALNNGR